MPARYGARTLSGISGAIPQRVAILASDWDAVTSPHEADHASKKRASRSRRLAASGPSPRAQAAQKSTTQVGLRLTVKL